MSMNKMINESIQYLLSHTLFFEYNKIQKMIFTMESLLAFQEKKSLYIALFSSYQMYNTLTYIRMKIEN